MIGLLLAAAVASGMSQEQINTSVAKSAIEACRVAGTPDVICQVQQRSAAMLIIEIVGDDATNETLDKINTCVPYVRSITMARYGFPAMDWTELLSCAWTVGLADQ